jgi:integrase
VTYSLQRLNGETKLVEPKTRLSRRLLILPDSIAETLKEHLERQSMERQAAGRNWKEWGLVFTTPIGTPLDGSNVTKAFQRLLKKAGLPRRRFHDLRHNCATLLLVQVVALRVVMDILGRSQISLTLSTYSHVLPGLKREAAQQMDRLLTGERQIEREIER